MPALSSTPETSRATRTPASTGGPAITRPVSRSALAQTGTPERRARRTSTSALRARVRTGAPVPTASPPSRARARRGTPGRRARRTSTTALRTRVRTAEPVPTAGWAVWFGRRSGARAQGSVAARARGRSEVVGLGPELGWVSGVSDGDGVAEEAESEKAAPVFRSAEAAVNAWQRCVDRSAASPG